VFKGAHPCDEVTTCMRSAQRVSNGPRPRLFPHCAIGALLEAESWQLDHTGKRRLRC
jgi:hypothetical protein